MKKLLHNYRIRILAILMLLAGGLISQRSNAQILAWELNGQTGAQATSASTTNDANLNTSTLTKGTLSTPSGGNAFTGSYGATGYTATAGTTLTTAQNTNQFLQFTMSAKAGYQVSLSTLNANFLRSTGNAPNSFQWEYSLDGFATAGVLVGGTITYNGSTSGSGTGGFVAANGTAQTQISLSGIAGLQNVPTGTTITFRIYGWGAGNTGSTFAIGKLTGNDLAIGGSVTPLPPTKLVITSITPTTPTAGANFSVTVQAQNANNIPSNVTSSSDITLTLATGSGALSGTLTGTIAAGSNSVTITPVQYSVGESGVSITATQATGTPALTAATSTTFTVNPAASKLVITAVTPGSPQAGVPFSITVQSQDVNGVQRAVTSATNISLTLATGTGTLGGTVTGTINNGASSATISGITYNTAEAGVSITATQTSGTPALTAGTSATFTVVSPPTQLVITSIVPASPSSGTNFSVTVQAQDAGGNPSNVAATTSVTLSKATGTGNLTGTLTANITAGTNSVTFNAVQYSVAESGVSITATRNSGDNLTAGTSATFTVQAGALSKFAVTTPAGTQVSGTPFNITITAQDVNGNTITSFNTSSALSASDGLTISPASTGTIFTNGVATLPVTLIGNTTSENITVTSGGKTGSTTAFGITADWYTKTTANLNVTTAANWTTDPTGGGAGVNMPSGNMFTNGNGTFHIQNTASAVTSTNFGNTFTVSGAGSKLFVGDGTNAISLTVVQNQFSAGISAQVNLNDHATLTLQDASVPSFGTIAPTSIVNYNSSNDDLAISVGTYGNLNITMSGNGNAASLSGATTVVGNVTISSTTTGAFALGGNTLNVQGDWINNGNTAAVAASTSTVNFNGTTQQVRGTASTTFNNLSVANGSTTTLAINTGIAGTPNVNAGGTLDLATFTFNRSTSGGTFNAPGLLRLSGSTGGQTGSNFPTNFSTYVGTVAPNTGINVEYYGATQTVYNAATYNNLTITTAGVKSITGNLPNISGNLTVNAGATFDMSTFTVNKSGITPGSLTLGAGSLLRLKGATGGIPGSNFPQNNATFNFDITSTVEYYGTSAQTIAPVSTGYGGLKVNNAAGLSLLSDVLINGQLAFAAGKIDATQSNVNLASTATTTGSGVNSHIVVGNGQTSTGHVNRLGVTGSTNGFFPIGDGTFYLPATITAAGGEDYAGYVFNGATQEGIFGGTPITDKSAIVDAIWDITSSSGNATIRLDWSNATGLEGSRLNAYSNASDVGLGISHFTGGSWQPAIGGGGNLTHTATATFNSFSPFAVGELNNPLPVTLINFKASLNNDNTVSLSWTTTQEVNSDHFAVLHSTDGSNWQTIGNVSAQGYSSIPVDYSFLDKSPAAGTNYYRLQMIDRDGKYAYSEIRVVSSTAATAFKVFPNPAIDHINVTLGKVSSEVAIRIINQAGQIMLEKRIVNGSGTTTYIPVNRFAQGSYTVQVVGQDGTKQVSKLWIARP